MSKQKNRKFSWSLFILTILALVTIIFCIFNCINTIKVNKYDINHDGKVNKADAEIITDYSTGKIKLICPRADLNKDGKIDSTDALIILQKI